MYRNEIVNHEFYTVFVDVEQGVIIISRNKSSYRITDDTDYSFMRVMA